MISDLTIITADLVKLGFILGEYNYLTEEQRLIIPTTRNNIIIRKILVEKDTKIILLTFTHSGLHIIKNTSDALFFIINNKYMLQILDDDMKCRIIQKTRELKINIV